MPRAYMPLKSFALPPAVTFSNGVRVVSREDFTAPTLEGWEQVFGPKDLKEMRDWSVAIACDWKEAAIPGERKAEPPPEIRLANTRLALQVVAPSSTFASFCIREQDEASNPRLRISEFKKFRGTPWSQMSAFKKNMNASQVQEIADGVLHQIRVNDARVINPLRLFEQGLVSDDLYIRVLLWVTAIDAITMAINDKNFVQRVSRLLGPDSLVFPQTDNVYIKRPMLVSEAAKSLFALRNEIAHGKAISKKFWDVRDDLRDQLPIQAYDVGPPRYSMLLEEAALALLTLLLQKTATGWANLYPDAKKWNAYLREKIEQ